MLQCNQVVWAWPPKGKMADASCLFFFFFFFNFLFTVLSDIQSLRVSVGYAATSPQNTTAC